MSIEIYLHENIISPRITYIIPECQLRLFLSRQFSFLNFKRANTRVEQFRGEQKYIISKHRFQYNNIMSRVIIFEYLNIYM